MESVWVVAARGSAAYLAMICLIAVVGGGLLWALRRIAKVAPSPLSLVQVFAAAVLGLLALVLLTAVVYTRGNTSMWLIMVVLLMIAFACREERVLQKLFTSKGRAPWPWVAAAIVLPFALFASVTYRFDGGFPYHTTYFDHYVFRTMVEGLARTGIETYFGLCHVLDPTGHFPTPYHFIDLWLMVFARAWIPIPTMELVCLTVPTVLLAIIILGIWAIAELFGTRSAWALALAPFVLCAGVFWWPALEREWLTLGSGIVAGSLGYIDLNTIGGKDFPTLIVALVVSFLLAKNCKRAAILTSGLFLLCDVTQSIIFLSIAIALTANDFYVEKKFSLHYLTFLVIIASAFASFYLLNYSIHALPSHVDNSGFSEYLTSNLGIRVNTVVKMGLQISLLTLPYLLLAVYFRRIWWIYKFNFIILTIAIASITGLLAWDVTTPLIPGDAIQFLVDPLAFLFVCTVSLMYFKFSATKPHIALYSLIGLMLLAFLLKLYINSFDIYARPRPQGNQFLQRVSSFIPQNSIGGYLKDTTDLMSPWQNYRKVGYLRTVGSIEQFFLPNYVGTVFMNDPIVPYNELGLRHKPISSSQQVIRSKQPFMRLWVQERIKDSTISLGQAQVLFAERYRIDWILATPTVPIQPELMAVVKTTIADTMYHDRMLILDSLLINQSARLYRSRLRTIIK